ncbi:hypothetical protein CPC08DRAFT_741246 [Agrocybe pediades]|nr:hypothetical protein CPC08DRAFT_741246 [Agrocybe pediades]
MDAATIYNLLRGDEEEEAAAAALLCLVVYQVQRTRQLRNQNRRRQRLYLCRPELLPNPRVDTPWQRLWESQNDRAFIMTMGFDVATFRYILDGPLGFASRWDSTPIPRNDVSQGGEPRGGRRSLDAAGALGLVLHYLGSSMLEVSLQQIFALTPSTLNRYLLFAQDILYETLRGLDDAYLGMPRTPEEYEHLSSIIQERHPLLTGAFGSIDGLSLSLQESDDPALENATYNAWKSDHCINNVIVFSPEVINAPRSWHDAHVARSIYDQLKDVPEGYYLVADTAFPRGTASIDGKIQAPLKSGQRIPANPVDRLRVPLKVACQERRRRLIESCLRLTNVRARRVGISQIRSVYLPVWKASEDERLWSDLGNVMFGDIRKRNRVSRFHLEIVNE